MAVNSVHTTTQCLNPSPYLLVEHLHTCRIALVLTFDNMPTYSTQNSFIVYYLAVITFIRCLLYMLQFSSRFHKVKKILSEDELFNRHVRQQELMIERMRKSSQRHGREIEKQVLVFDLKGIAMTVDLMAMRVFRRTLQIDEACYPERLHKLIMINAPSHVYLSMVDDKTLVRPSHSHEDSNRRHKVSSHFEGRNRSGEYPCRVWEALGEDFHWQYPETWNCSGRLQ